MAKKLKEGHILVTDESTGTMFPMVFRTLARFVMFPNGKSLLEMWNNLTDMVAGRKYITEQTQLGDNTFAWDLKVHDNTYVVMDAHIVYGLPTQVNNNTYQFDIALPLNFLSDITFEVYDEYLGRYLTLPAEANYNSSAVSVIERESSTFIKKKCVHNIYVTHTYNLLTITVEHHKLVDNVELSGEQYITGDFDIILHATIGPALSV